jgi:hypothetical protein
VTGPWFSPGPPVSSTNKTDRHDITEILLKVALNTINKTKPSQKHSYQFLQTQRMIPRITDTLLNACIVPVDHTPFDQKHTELFPPLDFHHQS